MKWFQNLSTMIKLMSAFAIVCALMLFVGVIGIQSTANQNDQLDTVNEKHLSGTRDIFVAEMNRLDVERGVRQVILATDPEARRTEASNVHTCLKDMEAALAGAEKTLLNQAERDQMKIIRDNMPEWADANRKAVEIAQQGHSSDALALLQQNTAATARINDAIDLLVKDKGEASAAAVKSADERFSSTRTLLVAIVIMGTLFALGLGYFISKALADPLRKGVEVLSAVAQGDLTQRLDVDSRDEMGQLAASLNAAVESMRKTLVEVAQSASNVSTASNELSSASQSISSGAQEQASSLEETAASLEEMTSAVKQNADNAQQAAQLAQGARDIAEKGGKVVGSAVEAMTEINASSRKIADIITAIDEIAFQTNLLALNAAVEAARAGEQGRGFAVVAGEVRNLAQRSASAAKEIKGLINDSVQKVESGSKLVNQSGATLDEIVTSVKRVTDIVGEIAASSREQSTGIEQVNTAVSQMDAVTQSNASQTEELAGTADGLASQAQAMLALVRQFKIGESDQMVTAAHAPTPRLKAKVLPMRKAGVHLTRKAAQASASSAPSPAPAAATGTDGFEEF